ncbi:MAG: membrane protein insertase YidC [Flavobacteriales bacterium]
MDRNSVIGLLLIAIILIGYTIINKPSAEQIEAAKRRQDSLALVEKQREIQVDTLNNTHAEAKDMSSLLKDLNTLENADSIVLEAAKSKFGPFYASSVGEAKLFTVETDELILHISSRGGYIAHAELKNFKTWDQQALELFTQDSTLFNIILPVSNRLINTNELYFTADQSTLQLSGNDSAALALRAYAGDNQYLEFVYRFQGEGYTLAYEINFVNLEKVIDQNTTSIALDWQITSPRHEKYFDGEQNNTTIYYKFAEDEVDKITPTSFDREVLKNRLKWVSFKQQYFTNVLIAGQNFDNEADLETRRTEGDRNIKSLSASLTIPYRPESNQSIPFTFYLGPNHYKTLKSMGMSLESQVPLGWGIFGWVNKWLVIPVFNLLDEQNLNYGIVILILTILIKLILFPLQFRSYLSQAKMRVLKPEIDEINKQYEKEDPLKKQQAVMNLYKKAGVNPLGGCLPMLFQIPVLFAMFNFFPAAIELRQESFLWANDLSTYDDLIKLPFKIPFYGEHVSLFALLMTISTIIYTRMNNQLSGANSQMPQLKWMMYLMPVIFLFVLNSFPAGLNYYYFLANVITFGQQAIFLRLVDEDKIKAKIAENKKKPTAQKQSKFQKRLEEMAKKRGYNPPRR